MTEMRAERIEGRIAALSWHLEVMFIDMVTELLERLDEVIHACNPGQQEILSRITMTWQEMLIEWGSGEWPWVAPEGLSETAAMTHPVAMDILGDFIQNCQDMVDDKTYKAQDVDLVIQWLSAILDFL